jgi:cyclopropane-fatty-acyl-phospholipid synthase
MLHRLFRSLIRTGELTVIGRDASRHSYGAAAEGVKPVTIRLSGRSTALKLLRSPALAFGEAYMDGRLTVEEGDIRDFLELVGLNKAWDSDAGTARARRWRPRRIAGFESWNWRRRARRNAARHYDLPADFFRLFLDPDLQYSCAYFQDPAMTLEEAQAAKKAHIAAKLCLAAEHRVLDIGCGWGGLALHLARTAGVEVHGITLSAEQLRIARARADAEGLADRVTFALADYRDVEGRYDRIVSIGMFEHVGPPHYRAFFGKCRSLLAPSGVMLLHTIVRTDGPGATDPFLARYIFPGGYIPALSQIAPALERARLWPADAEFLRLHYARTLACWYERTVAAETEIVRRYGERFLRMWLFYLSGGIAAFRHDAYAVLQLQLARHRDAVPLTRDYLAGR